MRPSARPSTSWTPTPTSPPAWPPCWSRPARDPASQPGTPAQVQANRARSVEKLAGAIKGRPDFADAYHLMADVHMLGGDRARAIAVLKEALKVNPDDTAALTMAVQVLADTRGKTPSVAKAELDQAVAPDQGLDRLRHQGGGCLAASNGGGFSRAPIRSTWPSPGARRPLPGSTRSRPGSTSATSCFRSRKPRSTPRRPDSSRTGPWPSTTRSSPPSPTSSRP